MPKDELRPETVAFLAHNFTLMLMDEIGVELNHEQGKRLWEKLVQVADGELTLMSSPADMLRPYPNATPEIRERLWAHINSMVRDERDIAGMISLDAGDTLRARATRQDVKHRRSRSLASRGFA